MFREGESQCLGLTHGKAADGIAIETYLHNPPGAVFSQVLPETSLYDAEKGSSAQFLMPGLTSLRPAV